MYTIVYPESYIRRARKFFAKNPDLTRQYKRPLSCWRSIPSTPSLRLHPLKGRLAGLHSVSINIAYRITLELLIKGKEIILVNVGKHEEVY